MKKSICVILLVAFMTVCCPGLADVVIDAAHFPDEAFRSLVLLFDKNRDGILQDHERATATDLHGNVIGGFCGENAIWTLNDEGVLTISGTGNMKDDDEDPDGPWHYGKSGTVKSIVIKDGITGIGDYAFAYCWSVSSISIPDSVTRIGEGAFCSTKITSIDLPGSLEYLGYYAFRNCSDLKSITIPAAITVLPNGLLS